jgi:hypothetical protein
MQQFTEKTTQQDKQAQKHMLGLAGEFLVAGELLRRNVTAAVSYGTAKKADVIAMDGRAAIWLEVKTTRERKWVLGSSLPNSDDSIWVLVHLPNHDEQPPEFYILTGAELHSILKPRDEDFRRRFREKHGREYDARGVVSVTRIEVESHKAAWRKVVAKLHKTNAA